VVATVIVVPALLLSFWLVLQYALVAHVRHVAQTAAQDAALAAAAGSGDASGTAHSMMSESVGALTSGVQVSPETTAEAVTVTVSADVLQVFPIGDFEVSVSASAPIERFVPQPERP
jgi:Flp pilus assembly protein TadG